MRIGLVKIIQLDSQLEVNPWRLVISSSKVEGVEYVKYLNLILVLGHYSTLFNKWMDGMKS